MVYVFAIFANGEILIDDDNLPFWKVATGKVAAHMLLRLCDEQPNQTQHTILDILAAWESAAHLAPPKG